MPSEQRYMLDYQVRMGWIRLAQKTLLYGTILGCCWIVCRYGFLSVRELAGKKTDTDILMGLYLWLKVPKTLVTAVANIWALGATGWALAERKSRKNIIARNHPLITAAQKLRDPGKGSSGITLHGDTAPEDI